MMPNLQDLLDETALRHDRLCPRQVLGVRMGLMAGKIFQLKLPQRDKSLFAIVECDGCTAGGIEIATGCSIDHRTMRVLDYGKLAATFIHTKTGQAIRIAPGPDCRKIAEQSFQHCASSWQNQLEAYQILSDEELFSMQPVQLTISLEKIISRPGLRVICEYCGEEISNEREIIRNGVVLCQTCAGDSYYASLAPVIASQLSSSVAINNYPGAPEEAKQIPVITVIGKSGAGKTTLLEKLVKELTHRGYHIATIKHHSHKGFDIDIPGKDSWRFAQAGSQHVVISAPDKLASYRMVDREISLDEIVQGIREVDIILVEGYKQANKPTIEVVRAAISQALLSDPKQCLAFAADTRWPCEAPIFDLDDVQEIAGLVEERFLHDRLEAQPGLINCDNE